MMKPAPVAGRENDPLMQNGSGGRDHAGSPAALRKNQRQWRFLSTWELRTSLLSWCLFTLSVLLFAFAFEQYIWLVWILVMLSVMMSILFILLGVSSGRREQVATGLLCIASVALAAVIGLYVTEEFMQEYWRLKDGAKFTDVSPTVRGAAYTDATELAFVKGAFVDQGHTVGRPHDGTTYCVAPVAMEGAPSTAVEFWAVGADCCQERSGFRCDDAAQVGVTSAISADPDGADVPLYREAIRQAESLYGLKSGEGAIFVRWLKSPEGLISSLWSGAVITVTLSIVLHLLASTGTSLLVKRLERRRY